jgi:beta-lactamase class A
MAGSFLSRRAFMVGTGLCFASACTTLRTPLGDAGETSIADLESKLGGRVGVAAMDTGDGARVSHRPDERFAMCSTFKLLLAAAILARVDHGEIAVEQRVRYGTRDLLDYSPVTKADLDEGSLPVNILMQAAIEASDNTAANLLLTLVGGPAGLTQFVRLQGDYITRLDRNEPGLNANQPGDERDTTTPNAMIMTVNKILLGRVLSQESREKLTGWMKNCRTGLARLRAGLPREWIAGDKTGTGYNGAANDVAIIWPPKRAPIVIAAYLSGSSNSQSALNDAHAKIGRIVAAAFA